MRGLCNAANPSPSCPALRRASTSLVAVMKTRRGWLARRAFTPVFDWLCPAMTKEGSGHPRPLAQGQPDQQRACDPHHRQHHHIDQIPAVMGKHRAGGEGADRHAAENEEIVERLHLVAL